MSKITKIFKNLKEQHKKAFIPFITAGDGGLDLTLEIMHNLVNSGADIIEIGVPFSDPMADGKIIASSHARAVKNDISLKNVFNLVKNFRKVNDSTGIVLMGYLNPIEAYGYDNFAISCKKNEVDGVLIVDNPPEEALSLKQKLDKNNVDLIFLITPTTTDTRIKYLKNLISGFVYFVSLKGVTGSGNLDIDLVNDNLARIHKTIDLPICVGFGIKDEISAKLVSKNADGVIVGSVLVAFIEKYADDKVKMLTSINDLAINITKAIK